MMLFDRLAYPVAPGRNVAGSVRDCRYNAGLLLLGAAEFTAIAAPHLKESPRLESSHLAVNNHC